MTLNISRKNYADLFGPTTGSRESFPFARKPKFIGKLSTDSIIL